jgi:hypothetical protein
MPIGGTAAFGINQHPRITTTYLNQLNRHGDPAPGVNVSTAQVSGSIVQPYDGFVGGKLTITNPWAKQFSDPEVGPLYGGVYMYVQVDPAATDPLARGNIVFWLDELNYIVTAAGQQGTPPTPNKVAGIAVNNTLPGHWDFFQISGIAMVLFTAAGTGVGEAVSVDPAATPPVPILGAATLDANFIGTTRLTTPVANELSPIELNILAGWNF